MLPQRHFARSFFMGALSKSKQNYIQTTRMTAPLIAGNFGGKITRTRQKNVTQHKL